MPNLNLLVGPPGSGKSTFSKTQKDVVYINQDSQGREEHFKLFLEAVSKGKNIVVDRMNFNKQQRARYLEAARAMQYKTIAMVFHTPRTVCFERCMSRKDHETIKDPVAANSALNLFFGKYERPEVNVEFNEVLYIEYDGVEEKPKAILCDLDGTLCNIDHRLHFVKKGVEGKKSNWPAFFRACERDSVNEWCADILRNFSGTHEIVFCSGRGEESREMTEKWLKDKNLWFGYLFMRTAGDYRPDNVAKEILLDFNILPQFEPYFVIDDRKQVVDMWRRRGFICLQCAEGDF